MAGLLTDLAYCVHCKVSRRLVCRPQRVGVNTTGLPATLTLDGHCPRDPISIHHFQPPTIYRARGLSSLRREGPKQNLFLSCQPLDRLVPGMSRFSPSPHTTELQCRMLRATYQSVCFVQYLTCGSSPKGRSHLMHSTGMVRSGTWYVK